jgi:ribosome-binding ATPase YchF (GTP1/OBG family)
VRLFDYKNIVHTEGSYDPLRDLKIINEELLKKDYDFVVKRLDDAKTKVTRY